MNNFIKGLLCALAATMIWSGNYPVSRFLFGNNAGDFNEFFMSFLRYILTLLCLIPFTFRNGDWQKFRENWRRDGKIFLLLSFFVIAEGLSAFIALKYTTAARASLLANTSPVFTLLISWLCARETLSGRKICGITLGLAGIIIMGICSGGDIFSSGTNMLRGDALALISGVFWALFTVFGTLTASRYGGVFYTCLLRILGLFLMLPLLFIFPEKITLQMPLIIWVGIFWLGLFPSGLAIALWSRGQKYLPPGVLGSFGYISAFSATFFSVVLLGEKITWPMIFAAVLIFSGMAVIMKKKKKIPDFSN